MWYFNPFACLYDLLQFSLGQRNGLDTRKEVGGRGRKWVVSGAMRGLGGEIEIGRLWRRDESGRQCLIALASSTVDALNWAPGMLLK